MSSLIEPPGGWRPGHIVNGHILLHDGRWVPLAPVRTNGTTAVTSLVTGVIGLLVCWIPLVGVVGFLFGTLAVIFGLIGRQRGTAEHRLMAGIGLTLGLVALLVCFGYAAAFTVAYAQ